MRAIPSTVVWAGNPPAGRIRPRGMAGLAALLGLSLLAAPPARAAAPESQAPEGVGRELVCRGYEASGNVTESQPAWPADIVTLFVTGKAPFTCAQTIQEHVDWVSDPEHSYVADGTGGLAIWAHPRPDDAERIAAVRGLAGMEMHPWADAVWDKALALRHDGNQPYLWAYGADDSHSIAPDRIGFRFSVARMAAFTEPALKKALREGAFYVSSGALISDIRVEKGTVTLSLPKAGDVRWLKSGQWIMPKRGEWKPGAPVVAREGGENRCLRHDEAVTTSRYALNEADGTTDPKAARFVRAVVTDSDGRCAWTMPFRIAGPAELVNPYPDKGGWYRGMTHNHSGATGLRQVPKDRFHRAYRSIGHQWEFCTDYGYWLTPFQRHPEGAIPEIAGAVPNRIAPGGAAEIELRGRHFAPSDRLFVGGRPVAGAKYLYETRFAGKVEGLAPGVYDLSLVTATGFRDTLLAALVVQDPGAGNAGWTTYSTVNSDLPGDQVYAVACAPDGSVWASTDQGLARFDGRGWKAFTRREHPALADGQLAIAFDRKGNFWSSGFGGLVCIGAEGAIRRVTQADGLADKQANQILIAANGDLWVSYNKKGRLSRSRDAGRTWEHFDPPNGAKAAYGCGLAEDRAGRILGGIGRNGAAVFDGKSWEVWNRANTGLADDHVYRIRAGRDGALYFAATPSDPDAKGGLAVLREGKWQTYPAGPGGLAHGRVWDVCADSRGRVWCATSRGVSRLSPDGKWTTCTVRNSGLAFDFVLGICEAPDGSMWFATGRGVSRLEEPDPPAR